MNFVKNTTWEKVFNKWAEAEANDPDWIHCATEIKGWSSWRSWRKFSASQIGADERNWQIFEFTDPINEVPEMLVGPYAGWQSRLPEKNTGTFSDLLNIPKQYNLFSKNDKVISIMNSFPFSTELIGIVRDDINKIVCVEGHHRAVAVTLAKKAGRQINFGKDVKIALTHLQKNEVFIFDEISQRGSSKNPGAQKRAERIVQSKTGKDSPAVF